MKTLSSLLLLCLACLALRAPALAAPQVRELLAPDSPLALDSLLSLAPSWTSSGNENGERYGYAVSSAGDVNGDGFDDVIIGAPSYLVGGSRTGAALVFLGRANGLAASPHQVLSNGVQGSYFGFSVSSAGDVNADGFDDIIVGAPHLHATIGYDGAAYLYLGSAGGLSAAPAWQKIGLQGDSEFGFAVSGAGDVNTDGFDDLIVGAPAYTQEQNHEGIVYLFLGSAGGPGDAPAWSYQSDQAGAQLGYALAGVGDLNHDSYADIAVGAPHFDASSIELNNGLALAFYGNGSGLEAAPFWQAQGSRAEANFGYALDSAGDVDGNGYPDLIVGAPGYELGLANSGAAFIFYNGPTGLSPYAGWMVLADKEGARFGTAVAGVGDADQDGFDDVAVGAPYYSFDQPEEGAVFVYRGGAAGAALDASWHASGDKAETEFGLSVASAGDVNGDDRADLTVGAPIYKRDERVVMGQAYVFHGGDAAPAYETRTFLPLVLRAP